MSSTFVIRSSGNARASKTSPSKEGTFAAEFTFINLSEPKQSKDKDLKKIVRSNAMRSFRQSERQKAVLKRTQKVVLHAGSCDIPLPFRGNDRDNDLLAYRNSAQVDAQDPPHLSTQLLLPQDFQKDNHSLRQSTDSSENGCINSLVRQEPPISPQALVGNGMGDPFNVYPSRDSSRYNDYVLNHCKPPLPSATDFPIGRYPSLAYVPTHSSHPLSSMRWVADTFQSIAPMVIILLPKNGSLTPWPILSFSWPRSMSLLPFWISVMGGVAAR